MHENIKHDLCNNWFDPTHDPVIKICFSCLVLKPTKTFKAKDNTCRLCRKLMALGLRYSYKVNLSAEVMLDATADGEALCYTCRRLHPVAYFAEHSYECVQCWQLRCQVEISQHMPKLFWALQCNKCSDAKDMREFPSGRLTCRSCQTDKQQKGTSCE